MRKLAGSVLLVLCAAGCGGAPDPVAQLTVAPATLPLGYPEAKSFRFSWMTTAAVDPAAGAPIVFVHLLEPGGEVVRTFDHPFPGPWQPQRSVSYDVPVYQSALAPGLPAGRYRVTVGLYGATSGERWPLEVSAGLEALPRFEYQVGWVEVPAAVEAQAVRFAFSPSWLAAEAGSDRQILARRWLRAAEGAIRVDGLRGPGTLRLAVQIPAGDAAGETLTTPDGTGASVVVSATCGDVEAGLSGAGPHQIEIPVAAAPAGGACEIQLEPNFRLRVADSAEELSVRLDNISWSPAR
jgi:hypothetical protein